MKICFDCGKEKPLDEFYKSTQKKDGRTIYCIDCQRTKGKSYYIQNRQKCLLKSRKVWLRRKYGITLEEYQSLLEKQEFSCAICKSTSSKGKGAFHVDHCHETGKVRGLLCYPCNVAIGMLNHNSSIVLEAYKYLQSQQS